MVQQNHSGGTTAAQNESRAMREKDLLNLERDVTFVHVTNFPKRTGSGTQLLFIYPGGGTAGRPVFSTVFQKNQSINRRHMRKL